MEKKPRKKKKEVTDNETDLIKAKVIEYSEEHEMNKSDKLTPIEERRVKKINFIFDKRQERTHDLFKKLLQRSPKSDAK